MKDTTTIFTKGKEIESENFIGSAWLQILIENDPALNGSIANVTFEPGARNNWHKHSVGQYLLVTNGEGYYQEEGKPAQVIRQGDVIKIPANVKHWHGATADNMLAHIAISLGNAQWLEPVTDDEYQKLNKQK